MKSLGQMDAFQIIHEALRAPRRQTLTASLAPCPFKLKARSPPLQTLLLLGGLRSATYAELARNRGRMERRTQSERNFS